MNYTNGDHATNLQDVMSRYILELVLAQQLGISLRTLQRARAMRKSPPYVLIGRQIYYRIDAVRAWLERKEIGTPSNR